MPSPSVFLQYRLARRHELPYHLHVSATAAMPHGSDLVTKDDMEAARERRVQAGADTLTARVHNGPSDGGDGNGDGDGDIDDMYGLTGADPRSNPTSPSRPQGRRDDLIVDTGGLPLGRTHGAAQSSIDVPLRGPPSWSLLPRRFPMGARSLALLRDPDMTLATLKGITDPEPEEDNHLNDPELEMSRAATQTRAEAEGRLNDLLGGAAVPAGLGPLEDPGVRMTTRRARRRRRGAR